MKVVRPRVVCLGMAVLDRVFRVAALPTGPTKLYADSVQEVGGGPASTAAAAIVRLGGAAALFARLGEDGVGHAIRAGLEADGVDAAGVRMLPGARSAWSAVAIEPGGERLILNTPGAGLEVEPDWVAFDMGEGGGGAALVDMGWPAGAARLLGLARAAGAPTVLDADLGPHAGAAALIDHAEHVVFSAPGLAHHAGTMDPAEGLRRMAHRARVVAVTLGAVGVLAMEGGAVLRQAAPALTVVDTLGAGDVFHGAYALALAEGQGLAAALRFATAAAALKCTRPGGRAGVPGRAEVEELLQAGWSRG